MFRFLCACIPLFSNTLLSASDDFRAALNKTTIEVVKQIESKYNVTACGFGGGTMYGVDTVALSFNINRPLTVDEARPIIVGAAELYSKAINENKAIRPFLLEYPFPITRIELNFFYQGEKSKSDDGHLQVFSIDSDKNNTKAIITYQIRGENNRLKTVYEETYNEAKERLHGNNG